MPELRSGVSAGLFLFGLVFERLDDALDDGAWFALVGGLDVPTYPPSASSHGLIPLTVGFSFFFPSVEGPTCFCEEPLENLVAPISAGALSSSVDESISSGARLISSSVPEVGFDGGFLVFPLERFEAAFGGMVSCAVFEG